MPDGPLLDAIYNDPVLAPVYDAANHDRPGDAFYIDLAGDDPVRILDVGCGTGVLAVELTRRGHVVTGLDPAGPMLDVARHRPGAEAVRWVRGDARGPTVEGPFDLIVMTGHVFQVFLDDADAAEVLHASRQRLDPNGRLAFETRNPDAREWDEWTPDATREVVTGPDGRPVQVIYRVVSEAGELVTFETVHTFDDGRATVSPSTLRFRSKDAVGALLAAAGFVDVEWFGDWDRSPVGPRSPEIIAVAQA